MAGYFGRPFETRKLVELDGRDKEYLRFELGAGKLIPALEQGVAGMSEGGVRQIVVPFRPGLGYPEGDSTHEAVGPKPSTFSGQVDLRGAVSRPLRHPYMYTVTH
mgnify:CR=1 FL=1